MSSRSLLFAAAWLLAICRASAALEPGPAVWGFDGTVVENSFNFVSVEIRNTGGKPFDGDIALDDGGSFGRRSCAPYQQKIFLAPGTARWVQFYPFIRNRAGSWRIVWKDERGEQSAAAQGTEDIKTGPPALVILADPESATFRRARMPVRAENLFPPSVTATDALGAAVLDHQPRWNPQQREAFLDWLKRGGLLHLLPGPDGAMPAFTDDLAALNIPGDRGIVGAGRIIKHKFPIAEVTAASFAEAGFPAPEIKKTDNSSNSYNNDETDQQIFQTLSALTKPNIAWGLIYFLTAIYIIVIGPVFYLQRKRDYRLLLAAFVLTVGLFAWVFTVVGRRGYGEKQIYHSLALARVIDGNRCDVSQWIHAFATSGDTYRFDHPGTGNLYAAIGDGENVRGGVLTGKDAHFDADIPLFSSRPFLHRGLIPGPDLGLKVTAFTPSKNPANQIHALTLSVGPGFPEKPIRIVAQYGTTYYRLERSGDTLRATVNSTFGDPLTALGTDGGNDNAYYYGSYNRTPEQARAELRTYGAWLSRTISNDSTRRNAITSRNPHPGIVRIFIYAEATDHFRLKSEAFQAGTAYILYTQDLPVGNP